MDAPLVLGLLLAVVQRPLIRGHGLDLRRRAMSLRVAEVRRRLGHEVAGPQAERLERRLCLVGAAGPDELRWDVDLLDRKDGVQLVPARMAGVPDPAARDDHAVADCDLAGNRA